MALKGISRTGAPSGHGVRVGIVRTAWNAPIVDVLFARCSAALHDHGVREEDIHVLEVPGSFELAFGVQHLIDSGSVDVVIPLGCLVKGETMHFEYIAKAVSQALMRLGLEKKIPVIFGVLTCLSLAQAEERASEEGKDHGYEWGVSAIEMARLHDARGT